VVSIIGLVGVVDAEVERMPRLFGVIV